MTAARTSAATARYDEFFLPYGLLTPGQIFALMAQRHMLDYGTSEKDLGQIALACRARANANPAAQMHDKALTMDDYLAARMISRPLRLYDFCLETDGACAVVVTSTERARDMAKPPALIRAVAQGSLADPQPGIQFPIVLRETLTTLPAKPTADTLYPPGRPRARGHRRRPVLRLLHDHGAAADRGLRLLRQGRGRRVRVERRDRPGRALPINTGGGHLSEGYIHGMNHVVEGVRQVRGESTSTRCPAPRCASSRPRRCRPGAPCS